MGKKSKREKLNPNPNPNPISTIKLQTLKSETIENETPFPIIGYFPSGFKPSHDNSKIRVLRHEKHPKRLQLVVSPNENSPLDFVGSSFEGEGAAPQLCAYRLGVLDRESGTLKIVNVPSNKIFRLEPKIAGLDDVEMEASKVEPTAENKPEKPVPSQLYSTKAALNKDRKMKKLYQNVEANNEEDVESKAEEIKKLKEAIESAGGLHARNVPPYDSSATEKEMAYPLDKIILAGEWDSLLDIDALWEAEQELAPNDYPSFVRNRVHLLGQKDGEERKKLACILSYITHLIKFNDRHSIEVNSAKHHRFPSIIHQKFTTMFAPSEKFKLPEEKKDLLISYVLVLTLFVDNFDTNPSDITKDLRMSGVKLRDHFTHLGCKGHKRKDNTMFELRLPLEFPKPRPKRRR